MEHQDPDDKSFAGDTRLDVLEPGQIIVERFKVISLIGRGGMGCVYKVEQIFLQKEFALKTLDPSEINDVAWRRFQKEAKAASMLEHPNLVKVHDFGLISKSHPFFVMDLFSGETLAQYLKAHGPLPVEDAIDIFIQVSQGLGYAHQRGIIHRDIKPSNIMLAWHNLPPTERQVKIVDFGIAKLTGVESEDALTLTRTGEVFGTPHYMSPEQCLGIALDYRADIYSLGCVMFEALAGSQPYVGDSALAIMMKHQSEPIPTLKEATLGKTFPQPVERIIERLLAKDPNRRYQNCYELCNDLQRVKKGETIQLTKAVAGARKANRYARMIKYGAGTLACMALVLGVFFVGRYSATQTPSNPPEPPHVGTFTDNPLSGKWTPPNRVQSKFFSTVTADQPSTRYFHFPTDKSLGELVAIDSATKVFDGSGAPVKGAVHASGEIIIENFRPFGIRPSADGLTEMPDMLTHFRPDEICALDFKNNIFVNNDTMRTAAALKKVRVVDLWGVDGVSTEGFSYLNKFPDLMQLDVSGAHHIGTPDLLELTNLRKLQHLSLKMLPDMKALLSKLKGSTTIKYLRLRSCKVRSQELDLIASMPALEVLDISRDFGLPGSDLLRLKSLRHLKKLCMQEIRFNVDEVLALTKQLPQLDTLILSTEDWPRPDVTRLKRALPNCRMFNDYESDLSKADNVIQDPSPGQKRDTDL